MVERITALDGVAATAPFTAVTASVLLPDGTQEPSVVVNVVEAATYASFYDLGVEAGSMGDLDSDHVAAYASTGLALGDEVVMTGPAGTVQATVAAIIDPKGVAQLLRAIDGYQGSPVVLAALRLAPLVFVRPGELRQAEWSEIDLDAADGPRWSIPAEKMKMRRDHIVPLSRQAVEIITEIYSLTARIATSFPATGRTAVACRTWR